MRTGYPVWDVDESFVPEDFKHSAQPNPFVTCKVDVLAFAFLVPVGLFQDRRIQQPAVQVNQKEVPVQISQFKETAFQLEEEPEQEVPIQVVQRAVTKVKADEVKEPEESPKIRVRK